MVESCQGRAPEYVHAHRLDFDRGHVMNCHHLMLWGGGGVMEHEFYRRLARRLPDIAERAHPFSRRRLLMLAERYEATGLPQVPAPRAERLLPISPPYLHVVRGPGKA